MADKFKAGDKVEWNTSQGTTTGTIRKKLTEETEIKGHTAKASKENPEYLVESDRSGKTAAHQPEALDKKSSK